MWKIETPILLSNCILAISDWHDPNETQSSFVALDCSLLYTYVRNFYDNTKAYKITFLN